MSRFAADMNISLSEEFSSHIDGLVSLIGIFLKYRKTYRNYLKVFTHVLRKKYPLKAILKNGDQIMLYGFFQSYNLAQLQDHKEVVEYDIPSDTVTISRLANTLGVNSQVKLKLHGGLYNGEVVNIFLEDVYRILPVKGKVVLDIGANIGDSSIYFALRGADKVIGVEPFPENYEMAKKNIQLNNFSNRISVMLAGCGAKRGYINIDADFKSGIASHIYDNNKQGIKVPLLSLENISNECKIHLGETILKMDCEGCEYDTILSASDNVLRWFSHMLIEYHYGYRNLKKRLEECDFDVSLVKLTGELGGPIALPNIERPGHWYYVGYIYAKRQSK